MSKKHTNHKTKTPLGEKDEWRTNPVFFKQLHGEFRFILDAAATDSNHLCSYYFTKEQNALEIDWETGKRFFSVFLNPPFSLFGEFLAKAHEEIQKHEKGQIVCIIRGDSPESKWFRNNLIHPIDGLPLHEIRHYWPRIRYCNPRGEEQPNIGFPTAIVIMRPQRSTKISWQTWKASQLYLPF